MGFFYEMTILQKVEDCGTAISTQKFAGNLNMTSGEKKLNTHMTRELSTVIAQKCNNLVMLMQTVTTKFEIFRQPTI